MKILTYGFTCALSFTTALSAAAQTGLSRANAVDRPENIANTNTRITNYGVQVQTVDANGKPYKALGEQSQGSPFYADAWSIANIRLATGTTFSAVSVRLNVLQQTLHFIDKKGIEMFLDAADLRGVEMIADPAKGDSVQTVFKTYVTQRTGQPKAAFYEVLAEGKITLLKQPLRKIVSNKNEFTQEVTKEVVAYTEYYVYKDNVMEEVKRKASFWEKLMQDQWNKVDAYVSKQELSFRSYEDLQKIVQYYNSL